MVDRAKTLIKRYYDEKGFKNAKIEILQRDVPDKTDQVYVEIKVDRRDKIKVNQLIIDG
jgi:outer membrane protein insertion porin family